MPCNVCCLPITENTGSASFTLKGRQTLAWISPLSTSFAAGLRVSKAHNCTYGMKNESPEALSHIESVSPNHE